MQHRRPEFSPWVRKIPWRKELQPTPVFLPEESHRHRSLVDYGPQDHKESDTTEWLFLSTMEGLLHEGWALPQGSKIIVPIIWTWTWHLTTLGFAEFWGWQLFIERHKQYIDLRKIFGVMSNSLLTSSKCWKMMVSKYEQNQLRLRNFLKEIWVNESGK